MTENKMMIQISLVDLIAMQNRINELESTKMQTSKPVMIDVSIQTDDPIEKPDEIEIQTETNQEKQTKVLTHSIGVGENKWREKGQRRYFTADDIRDIRSKKKRIAEYAIQYQVSCSTICSIQHHKTHKDIE